MMEPNASPRTMHPPACTNNNRGTAKTRDRHKATHQQLPTFGLGQRMEYREHALPQHAIAPTQFQNPFAQPGGEMIPKLPGHMLENLCGELGSATGVLDLRAGRIR